MSQTTARQNRIAPEHRKKLAEAKKNERHMDTMYVRPSTTDRPFLLEIGPEDDVSSSTLRALDDLGLKVAAITQQPGYTLIHVQQVN